MPLPNPAPTEQVRIDGQPMPGMPDASPSPGMLPPVAEGGATQVASEHARLSDKLRMIAGWAGNQVVGATVAVRDAGVRAAIKAREYAPVVAQAVREHGPAVAALAVETGLHGHLDRKARTLPGFRGGVARTGADIVAAAARHHHRRTARAASES